MGDAQFDVDIESLGLGVGDDDAFPDVAQEPTASPHLDRSPLPFPVLPEQAGEAANHEATGAGGDEGGGGPHDEELPEAQAAEAHDQEEEENERAAVIGHTSWLSAAPPPR